MTAETRQSPFPCPRPRLSFIGVVCLVATSLGAYLALIGFGVWHPAVRRPAQPPILTDVAQGPITVNVSPGAFELTAQLESFTTELNANVGLNSPDPDDVHFPVQNPRDAATFAATAANKECLRIWRRAPFASRMYPATMLNGRWHWGRYDPFGPDGFSAEVSFGEDASALKVQINFSTDKVDWKIAE